MTSFSRGFSLPARWTFVAGTVAMLALSACATQGSAPLNDRAGDSGGQGGMAYPAPLPQGNISTTPVR
jgi:hypothetical protein